MMRFSTRCDSGLVQTILQLSLKTQNELPDGLMGVTGKTNSKQTRRHLYEKHLNNLISVANLRAPREREGRDKES